MEKIKMPTEPKTEIRYGMLQNENDFVDWIEDMIECSKTCPSKRKKAKE